MFNQGKVQRSQWINRRSYQPQQVGFLPDIRNIGVDMRNCPNNNKNNKRKYSMKAHNTNHNDNTNKINTSIE